MFVFAQGSLLDFLENKNYESSFTKTFGREKILSASSTSPNFCSRASRLVRTRNVSLRIGIVDSCLCSSASAVNKNKKLVSLLITISVTKHCDKGQHDKTSSATMQNLRRKFRKGCKFLTNSRNVLFTQGVKFSLQKLRLKG